MIIASNVSKVFLNGSEDYYALKDVSIKINDDDFTVILGPSGAGKSTLLNVLSGLETCDFGEICYIMGEDNIYLNKYKDKDLVQFRRKHIGFIFQAYHLLPDLNVENNIKIGSYLARNYEYMHIVEELGIHNLLKKMPYQLSGGEQQRVSIARALAKKPDVLFCDEPTGSLDEQTGKQVLNLLSEFQRENKIAIVMVTHNPGIADMATHVIRMNSGRILDDLRNENIISATQVRWA